MAHGLYQGERETVVEGRVYEYICVAEFLSLVVVIFCAGINDGFIKSARFNLFFKPLACDF